MTMAASITVGGFTLNGFVSGSFAPTLTFDDAGHPTDDYVFNWSGPDYEGNNTDGQIVTVNATTDSWSLSVKLDYVTLQDPSSGDDVDSGTGESLWSGSTFLVNIDSGYTSFSGTGNLSLQNFIQSLHVDTPNGGPGAYRITFTLTDTTTADSHTWNADFVSVACFGTGTRIAVPGGEAPVEKLRIGDLVITATGAARPVKWIGRRAYTAAQLAANPHLRPVLVRKGAIAPGMPHRDLSLSPMHSLFIDDVFVPVVALVNGVSILRSDEIAPVSYIHIEMDRHDVVFAEGQPAETYVDDASRQMFDNADEYYDIYGADQGIATFAAARIEEGVQLEALRRRIAARAGLAAPVSGTGKLRGHVERLEDGVMHGWVFDTTAPSVPVEIEVLADGELVATAIANRYRVDLDHAGLAGGRAGFTVVLPASVTSLRQVTVRRAADHAGVAVPAVAMAD